MATAQRTIIKTETPGWFEDPDTGKKTRKKDGDRIVTRDEYIAMITGAESEVPAAQDEQTNDEPQAEANGRAPAEKVTLSSGKTAVGKTVEISCAWVAPDVRTPAQEKLFAKGAKALDFGAVVKAGAAEGIEPCGNKRTIKAQDAFQVRFCTEHQPEHRRELRRRKSAAKRAAK